MKPTRRRSQVARPGAMRRAICSVLVCAQISVGVPLPAWAAQAAKRPQPQKPETAEEMTPAAPAPRVVANRKVPSVTPPALSPMFSRHPSDRELAEARIFGEPLTLSGRATLPGENRALADIVERYLAAGSPEAVVPFWAFLKQYPDSPWRASLLLNIGIVYRRTGYFSRALEAWESVWDATKANTNLQTKAIADRALGELFELHARLGRFDRLEALLAETKRRPVRGRASEQITAAREGLWLMRNRPDQAFRCGPLAVDQILAATRPDYARDDRIRNSKSTDRGTSLVQMQALAAEFQLPMQMARRSPGAAVVLPALVHWRAGHFAALIREENERYLVRDPTFEDEIWISKAALDDEATGYMLIATGELPARWRQIGPDEGDQVWGKGNTNGNDNKRTRDCEKKGGGGPGDGGPGGGPGGNNGGGCNAAKCPRGKGMPEYSAHLMVVSLSIQDTPVGYAPPRGPAVHFAVTYNQREAYQPQTFSFGNLGAKWTFDWLSYIEDDPTNGSAPSSLAVRGGGRETYEGYNSTTQSYAPELTRRTVLVRTGSTPIRYELRHPDGAVDVYAQPDGALVTPRRVFLTESRDSSGNSVAYTYDAQLRLVAVTDAIGQVTTLSYEDATDIRHITRVTDPFGRFATFQYDALGRLERIVDVIGLESTFQYDAGDFITAMTTPYGTSRFTKGEDGTIRWLELTDPMGGRERVEYRMLSSMSASEPVVPSAAGISFDNANLQYRNTFYWDKRAMATAPRDLASAHIFHWLHTGGPLNQTSGTLESERPPLERRIWYRYPGQTSTQFEGSMALPSVVGRVLDDGTSELWRKTYNTQGQVLTSVDPVGRSRSYTYATNGIDLLEVRQINGAGSDLLTTLTYNAQHAPLTITDASGQTATYTYNTQGQLLTTTAPARAGITEDRTTTYAYDSNWYLQSITAPTATTGSTFTYDDYGRVRTKTSHDGYSLTIDYDALDRMTKMTFPDGTYRQTFYSRLDAVTERDRLGRLTHTVYDAVRRPIAVRDGMGSVTTFSWCNCGSLDKIVDGNGNTTSWERDVQGRVTRARRPDGSDVTFTYRVADSRVVQLRDAKLQVSTIQYFPDGNWKQVAFTNTTQSTPTVSYTYDTVYNRLATLTDGTGTTSYTYYPVTATPSLGSLLLQSVDGPFANDVITYTYDEHGRIVSRSVNGVALTQTFDALSRVTGETNVLGTFAFGYDGFSDRLTSVACPNGQSTTLGYLGNLQDQRLADIHNKRSGGATLSRFQYTYAADGGIATWRQQVDSSTATQFDIGRDPENRLATATLKTVDTTPVTLKRYGYSYDRVGNRVGEQIDDSGTEATVNTLNQVTSRQAGGALRFAGTVNEAATVTIQGKNALVTTSNEFSGSASVPSGTSTVNVTATDYSGNTQSKTYQVTQSGAPVTLTYDANGSLLSDGTRTFEWDGANRLTAVDQGTHRTEFSYDGWSRRVRVVEKDNGVVAGDIRLLWCGQAICEQRDSTGASVTRRFFDHGMQEGGAAFFYARDHLDSIRELTDATGAVRARYDYDPFGRTTKLSGDLDSPQTFTGHFAHAPSGLLLAPYRAYDPGLGRWINVDPLGFLAGSNFYAYGGGAPMDGRDATGLLRPPTPGEVRVVLVTAGAVAGGVSVGWLVAGAVVVGGAVAVYYWWTSDDAPSDPQTQAQAQQQGPGGESNSQTGTDTKNSSQDRRQQDYDEYKKRCNEKPPGCLTPCERAKWILQRNLDCVRMIQEWDNKYEKGVHAEAIRQRQNAAENARQQVDRLCK